MPGVDGANGSATPTAKTTVGALYSPSVVVRMKRVPSGPSSRRVDVQRQSYRIGRAVRSTKAARLRSISGRDGKYDVPSMNSGMIARSPGPSPRSEFQS